MVIFFVPFSFNVIKWSYKIYQCTAKYKYNDKRQNVNHKILYIVFYINSPIISTKKETNVYTEIETYSRKNRSQPTLVLNTN